LRGNVGRRVVEVGRIVGQDQVEVGDVDLRLALSTRTKCFRSSSILRYLQKYSTAVESVEQIE
jgi:hypothetical protein